MDRADDGIAKSMKRRFSQLSWVLVALSSSCAPAPHFAHSPVAGAAVNGPHSLVGSWARAGRDNGERALVSKDGDDGVKVLLFASGGKPADIPTVRLRLTRFGAADWAVADMQTLGPGSPTAAPYVMLRYEYNGQDRLCARTMAASPLVAAVRTGQLEGVVGRDGGRETVAITAPAEAWVGWWETQPDQAALLGGAEGCFVRVED